MRRWWWCVSVQAGQYLERERAVAPYGMGDPGRNEGGLPLAEPKHRFLDLTLSVIGGMHFVHSRLLRWGLCSHAGAMLILRDQLTTVIYGEPLSIDDKHRPGTLTRPPLREITRHDFLAWQHGQTSNCSKPNQMHDCRPPRWLSWPSCCAHANMLMHRRPPRLGLGWTTTSCNTE